jgi:predicted flap endonuclease-1-like 5' DNA nuclease
MEEIMFRWFVRFSIAAFLGALLVWLWNRYNQDLLEDDFDEEEIPLEFDVPADGTPALEPGNTLSVQGSGDGTHAAAAPPVSSTVVPAPEEPAAGTIRGSMATEDGTTTTAEPAAEETTGETATTATETPAAQATDVAADSTVETMPAEATDVEAEGDDDQELLLDSPAPTPAGAGDNVIAIKGIGPKYAEKLAEMGITTFGALIATPIDTLAITFPRVSEEELHNWLEQARELADQSTETA